MISSHNSLLTVGVAAFAVLSSAAWTGPAQAQTADMTVTATAVAACTLSAGEMNFGAYVIGQADPKDAVAEITYECAPDLAIQIELDFGLLGNVTSKTRNMSNNGSLLPYNLFQDDARSIVWAEDTDAVFIDPTPGSEATVPVFGRIPAGQSPEPGQVYEDTVKVTLTIEG